MNVAVIYFSATGTVQALAEAAAEGAEKAGAVVRLRPVDEAGLDDLVWADVVLFGTPTRFGNPASRLRAFMETTGGLWREGRLADKVYSAFTASTTRHGGQEATLLALGNTFHHWGGIIVPPGYTDPVQLETGNPYGTSHTSGDGAPGEAVLEAARHQARRCVEVAAALKAGRVA